VAPLVAIAPPASAAPTHVAVVIAGDRTVCVNWFSGMTGLDALEAAASSVEYGQGNYRGLVVKIDGVGSPTPTTQLYWSYWHDNGGGWSYSSYGPASYDPKAGSVEGWIYNDGKTAPPSASYASVCGSLDPKPTSAAPTTAAPKPEPSRSTVRSTGSTAPSGIVAPPPPSTTRAPAPNATTATSDSTSATPTNTTRASPTASGSPTSSRGTSGSAVTSQPTSGASPTPSAATTTTSTSTGAPTAVIVAVLAIAGLGGAAAWLRRRTRG